MRQRLFIVRVIPIIICLLTFIPFAFSLEGDVKPLLDKADTHLFEMRLEEAERIYESVLQEGADNYETLWRMSRCYLWQGMVAEKKKDKKEEWNKSKELARRAVEVNPNGAEGHLYVAIAAGKIARLSSGGEKVKASWEIKEAAENAIKLDPKEPKGYLTLGAWHRSVATSTSMEKSLAKMFFGELPQGTLEESLELLLKSINLGGTNVKNYYELALTYEAMGDYEAAKREFNKALAAPSVSPEDNECKEEIKNILKKGKYAE